MTSAAASSRVRCRLRTGVPPYGIRLRPGRQQSTLPARTGPSPTVPRGAIAPVADPGQSRWVQMSGHCARGVLGTSHACSAQHAAGPPGRCPGGPSGRCRRTPCRCRARRAVPRPRGGHTPPRCVAAYARRCLRRWRFRAARRSPEPAALTGTEAGGTADGAEDRRRRDAVRRDGRKARRRGRRGPAACLARARRRLPGRWCGSGAESRCPKILRVRRLRRTHRTERPQAPRTGGCPALGLADPSG